MYDWKDIFKNSYQILLFTAFIGIMGGQMLNSIEMILVELPVLLFLFPVMNGVGGNLGIVLGARISSGLHSGYIEAELGDEEMKENILVSLLVGCVVYASVSLALVASSTVIDIGILSYHILLITIGAGLILTASIVFLTLFLTFISYRKKLDPDDVVPPLVTTVGDFIGIASLLFMIWVVIL